MKILRTFHVRGKEDACMNVTESSKPYTCIITLGTEKISLSKEQFDALCELRYKLEWAYAEDEAN